MIPRKHQQDCIQSIATHFKTDSSALIKMFCGSGKSLIIHDCLIKHGNNLAVVVVPSINLITQFSRDYLLDKTKKELLTVCSKDELKKSTSFTTDPDVILEFLEMEQDKIILITYQSLKLLFDVVKENELEIDLICFDEAHHILADGMKLLLFGTDEDDTDDFSENFIDTYVKKALYFTATPKNSNGIKMYEPITDIIIDDKDYEIVDDNDTYYQEEIHCGKMVFEYMHTDGVNDNILNDFNVRVDLYTENTDESVFEAISRAILETGNSRVLTFHSRSETKSDKGSDVSSFTDDSNQKKFKKCFDKVVKNEFPKHKGYKKIHFKGITAATKNKVSILKQFDETPDNEIFILASCKTIGEGTDVPGANMVVFIDPKQSYVEIIQNIGRICRKNERTKRLATVLIPCYVDVGKYKECKTIAEKDKVIRNEMNKSGDFNGILNVISALRQEDPYMFEMCLKHPEVYTEKEMGDNLRKHGLECENKMISGEKLFEKYGLAYDKKKSEEVNFKKLGNKIDKNIQVMNNRVNDADLYIDGGADETMYLVKKDDDKYVMAKGKCDGIVRKCNRNVKPYVCASDDIMVLWDIDSDVDLSKKVFGGYIKSTVVGCNVDDWMMQLALVQKYIDKNNKRPSKEDTNQDVKYLGGWISTQIKNYAIRRHIMKNENIQKKWDSFVKENEKYFMSNDKVWNIMLNKVKVYFNKECKRPSQQNNNPEISRMGKWLSQQQINYARKKDIMKNEQIYKKWEAFVKENKHHFMSNEKEWYIILDNVKNYIIKEGIKPSAKDKNIDVKHMGGWIGTQQKNYAKKQCIMTNEDIYKKWEEFVKDNKKYFIINEEKWYNMLDNIKNYIDDNKKRPPQLDKNNEIAQLARWINNQQNNYDKMKKSMKNPDKRKKWEEFLETYKQYFITNEELWNNMLDKVKNYIVKEGKRPSNSDKNNDIRQMARWIGASQTNYAKKKEIMKNEDIRRKWEEFVKDNREHFTSSNEDWYIMLNNVINYIDKEGNRPSSSDKNLTVKQMGSWILHQQKNYVEKRYIMTNIEICRKWEEFVKDNKEHFMNNEETWQFMLGKVKNYIDKTNKKPSQHNKNQDIKQMGAWIQTQQWKYAKKQQVMKNPDIRHQWEQFITSHQQYFPDNPAIQSPEKSIIDEPVQKLVTTRDSTSQKAFKDELLKLYNSKCIITGSTKPLEGAHIIPYSECNNFKMNNGLLLRNDIHALFDDHDITINPDTMKVELSKEMQSDETYKTYHMKQIKISDDVKTNLIVHYKRFMTKHSDESDEECKPKKVIKKKNIMDKTKVVTK